MIERTRAPIAAAITALAMLFLYVPLVLVVLFSFHESASLSLPFTGFSLRWYEEVIGSPTFRAAARNSLIVATVVTIVTLVVGTMAAYGLSRVRSGVRNASSLAFFLPITVPGLFIGISLLVWFDILSIRLSLMTVAAAHFVFVFPFFLLMAAAALSRLDPSLNEAAADLGAGPWRTFWTVTIPQVWPVLLGAGVLAFALSFDEFIITYFVTGGGSTVPLYIWSSLRRTVDPSINAVSTLLLGITLGMWVLAFGVYVIAQRRRDRDPEALLS